MASIAALSSGVTGLTVARSTAAAPRSAAVAPAVGADGFAAASGFGSSALFGKELLVLISPPPKPMPHNPENENAVAPVHCRVMLTPGLARRPRRGSVASGSAALR